MRANAPPPTWSSRARCRAARAAWLRPARSPLPERAPARLAVVGAGASHLPRLPARAAALAPAGRDALDQRQQVRDVGAVRARQARRAREAAPCDRQVALASRPGAPRGTSPGLRAAVTGSDAGTVNDGPLPGGPPPGLRPRAGVWPQPVPGAPRVPLERSAAAGLSRGEVARRGERLPRPAGLQDEGEAGPYLPRGGRLSSRVPDVAALLRLRQRRLDAVPQSVGEERVSRTAHTFV